MSDKRAPKEDRRGKKPLLENWKELFLATLADTGNVRAACHHAKISSQVAYAHKAKYPKFCAKWDDALENATDLLELEARRRALGQKEVDPTRCHSDTLMIFLLKAHRPEKYDPQRAINALLQQVVVNTTPKPRSK